MEPPEPKTEELTDKQLVNEFIEVVTASVNNPRNICLHTAMMDISRMVVERMSQHLASPETFNLEDFKVSNPEIIDESPAS